LGKKVSSSWGSLQLIPRLISVWGFIAALALSTGSVLTTFIDISPAVTILVQAPIAVQEMVLAIWLIVKGFNSSAIASESAK
jgi:hypothetical protein